MELNRRKETGRNPRTLEEAESLIRYVESLCMPWNVEEMAHGFTEDCVARFGTYPEMRGRAAVLRFFQDRSARQKNYRLRKELRAMMNDVLAMDWTGTWEDTTTGKKMEGHGVEIWTLREGKLARWEAAFNIKAEGESGLGGIT